MLLQVLLINMLLMIMLQLFTKLCYLIIKTIQAFYKEKLKICQDIVHQVGNNALEQIQLILIAQLVRK
jgi:hypothetical protein